MAVWPTNKGRGGEFQNTIIIMTSNLGSGLIRENFERINAGNHDEVIENQKSGVRIVETNHSSWVSEPYRRTDYVCTAQRIADWGNCASANIADTENTEKTALNWSWPKQPFTFIADEGFDPQFGARPVKRAIQKFVLNDLSKQLISGTVNNEAITVDFDGEKLVYRN